MICVCFVFYLSGQTVQGEMDYGDNTMEWQTIATDEPVNAFVPRGNTVWYATASTVGVVDVKTGKKTLHQQMGNFPSEGVKTVAKDRSGNIWIGSANGVVLSEGSKFKTFTKEDGLSDNAVNKIFVSDRGRVWAGTQNGVSCYSGGKWSSYTTDQGLCGNSVRDIVEDNDGTIWFATNKGISTFNGSTWKTYDMKSGLSWNDVKALGYDSRKNEIWAAVGEKDVNNWDGKEWKVFMTIEEGITCIMADTQSRIWFGTETGILKYNGFEWIYDQQKIGFPAAQVKDMYRDEAGDLWFALETGVLHMKNPYPF